MPGRCSMLDARCQASTSHASHWRSLVSRPWRQMYHGGPAASHASHCNWRPSTPVEPHVDGMERASAPYGPHATVWNTLAPQLTATPSPRSSRRGPCSLPDLDMSRSRAARAPPRRRGQRRTRRHPLHLERIGLRGGHIAKGDFRKVVHFIHSSCIPAVLPERQYMGLVPAL